MSQQPDRVTNFCPAPVAVYILLEKLRKASVFRFSISIAQSFLFLLEK
jgi:hypothetical protein